LVVALVEQWDSVVSSAVTALGHDPEEMLRGLCGLLIEERPKTPRHKITPPFSPPSGSPQWLFQGPTAKSKFLAAAIEQMRVG
jgi:hypothetical protein